MFFHQFYVVYVSDLCFKGKFFYVLFIAVLKKYYIFVAFYLMKIVLT
jgi:hypothetical protein